MLRVDCQSHILPPAYAELLLRNPSSPRTVKANGEYVVSYGDVQQFRFDLAAYGPAAKLRDMDEAGIDLSVLSVNIPGPELLSEELGIEGAALCNDYLAEVCARYPDRFIGLASLPLQNLPAALAELERAIHTLGLRGVILYSHINGTPVDAPQFEPFYSYVEEHAIPIVLHPTVPTWSAAIRDYSMIPMLGLMVDTSIAMLRLILGGVLERHPNLKVVHPHLGGVLPYLMGRIVEQTEIKGRGREHITRSPESYYQQVYLDTVSPSPLTLEYAYKFAGPSRLLFGTDHPWVKMGTFVDLLEQIDLPSEAKARIWGTNALELFRL